MRLIAYAFDFLQENHFVFKYFPIDGQFNGLNSLFFFRFGSPTRLDDKSDVIAMVMKVVIIFGVSVHVKRVHSTEMDLFVLIYQLKKIFFARCLPPHLPHQVVPTKNVAKCCCLRQFRYSKANILRLDRIN